MECLREFLDRRIKDGVISISQLSASETVNGGTVCRKAARTGVRPDKVDISNGCKSHQNKSQSSVAK